MINGPGSFALVTNATANGSTITVTVRDNIVGQTQTVMVTQAVNPVVLVPATSTLPAAGGSRAFQVSGGSETTVDQGGGFRIVVNPSPVPALGTVTIDNGGTFTFTTDASTAGMTFTITAIDRLTNQQMTATVMQAAAAP